MRCEIERRRDRVAYLAQTLDKSNDHQPVVTGTCGHRDQQSKHRIDQHTDAKKVFRSVTFREYSEWYLRDDVTVEERAEQVTLHGAVPMKLSVMVLWHKKEILAILGITRRIGWLIRIDRDEERRKQRENNFACRTYGQGGSIVARILVRAFFFALVQHGFLALRDGGVIDHRHDRHGHIRPHHVSIRHAEEQHQSHYVTRPHQCCNVERSLIERLLYI